MLEQEDYWAGDLHVIVGKDQHKDEGNHSKVHMFRIIMIENLCFRGLLLIGCIYSLTTLYCRSSKIDWNRETALSNAELVSDRRHSFHLQMNKIWMITVYSLTSCLTSTISFLFDLESWPVFIVN